MDGKIHLYPHPQYVYQTLPRIFYLVHELDRWVEEITDPVERLLFTFGLSAFAQFHFLDLHPFADGNGRVSRFLGKHILDKVLPFPFPMYKDKDAYITSLDQGRLLSDDAPKGLAKLMLDEAICYFQGCQARS